MRRCLLRDLRLRRPDQDDPVGRPGLSPQASLLLGHGSRPAPASCLAREKIPWPHSFTLFQTASEKKILAWQDDAGEAAFAAARIPSRPSLPGIAGMWRGPSQFYNGKIHPLVPFPIRGSIWCQGTSNGGDGVIYAGTAGGIHYQNKLHPGMRMARWALAKEYGKDTALTGPSSAVTRFLSQLDASW